MEEASGEGRILYEATTPYLDPTQTANTFMLGVEPPVIDATNYLLLEAVQAIYDSKITVTDRDEERGFLLPKIEFPEEEVGSVHIDMGFGSLLMLIAGLCFAIFGVTARALSHHNTLPFLIPTLIFRTSSFRRLTWFRYFFPKRICS